MLDVTNKFPWNKFEERTVDGVGDFVFIPKTYVKNVVNENGTKAWYVAKSKLDSGYHLHPMFMDHGAECATGVLIGKYLTKGSASAPTSVETGSLLKLGLDAAIVAGGVLNDVDETAWHMYNVYEHHFIARLLMIEAEGTDIQNQIGGSATANGVTHYGITDVWGSNSENFWLAGLDTRGTDNTKLRVYDNKGNQTFVDTGVAYPSSGWVVDVLDDSGTDFDFKDLFVAKTTDGTESNGTFGDYQYFDGGYGFIVINGANSFCGPFRLYNYGPTASLAFRLAKFV